MSTSPFNVPRFVPLLTEVVQTTDQLTDDVVHVVITELNLFLERRLLEETKLIQINLQQELRLLVQQTVTDAMKASRQPNLPEKI